MQVPATPLDETSRLKALYSLQLLDTPTEERFDLITRLATILFRVPIALISLIDQDRQWFKSRQDFAPTEIPRAISFCAHTILQDQAFIIEDTLLDSRFADSPLVTNEPHIRFYAGETLHTSDGGCVGTLCVLDRQPRQLSAQEIELLQMLGRWAERELNNTTAFNRLEENQLFIQKVAETIPGLLYLFDLIEQRNVYVNREVGEMLGYSPEEIAAMGATLFPRLMHPDDLALIEAHNARFATIKAGEFLDHDYRLQHKNGEWRWIYSCDTVFSRTTDGRPHITLGIALDITARKQAEAELKNSQNLYRTLAANIPGSIVCLLDRNLNCILLEGNALTRFGLSKERVEGENMQTLLPPPIYQELLPHFKLALAGTTVSVEQSYEGYTFEGYFASVLNEQGEIYAVEVMWQDITGRKQLEEQARYGQELFARIFQIIPLPIAINRLSDGQYLDVNNQFVKQSGYQREELIGHNLTDKIQVEPASFQRLLKLLGEQGSFANEEIVYRIKDGRWRTALESAEIFEIAGEKHSISVFTDITEQKETNSHLKFLAGVLAHVSDAVVALDKNYQVTYWNKRAEQLYKIGVNEALGQPLSNLYQTVWLKPEDETVAYQALAESGVWQGEIIHIRRDGTKLYIEATTSVLKDEAGQDSGLLAVLRDITERKLAEEALKHSQEQLLQMQKLDSIGRLAGGVAHDFNNLLTGILGYADLALLNLDEADPLRADLLEIKNGAERGASLTQQLLAFSRRQVLQPTMLDLNEVIEGMGKLLRRVIGEDVELVYHLATKLHLTKADRGQLEQVLMNLAVNARDAMPNGGHLTFETKNVEVSPTYSQQHLEGKTRHCVLLKVSDSGLGMDAETLSHIFEPFFTTKEQGKGTGLGLATVFGIIKQSGGHIEVSSEPGHGTTFAIYLPRTTAEKSVELPVIKEASALNGQQETILLVEDDNSVRVLTHKILVKGGYKVLEASSVEEALRLCRQHGSSIQLILTDLVMPESDGVELVKKIRQLRPDLAVLFMSGYSESRIVQQDYLPSGYNFIQKPFTIEGLLSKIQAILQSQI